MGFLSRIAGGDKFSRALETILEDAARQAASGAPEFVVSVRESDFPLTMSRLDVLVPVVVERLQERGFVVLGVDAPEWSGAAYIKVAGRSVGVLPSAAQSVGRTTPPEFSTHAAPTDPMDATGEERATREIQASFGRREHVGSPFGPGLGLEASVAIVERAMPDPRYRRMNARGMCSIHVHQLRHEGVALEDWDRVLGHTKPGFKRHRVGRPQAAACVDAVGEAKLAMFDVLEESGEFYDRWARDDRFVAYLLAIHYVVQKRLEADGIVTAIDL